jgi:NADPH2:quinone reductase
MPDTTDSSMRAWRVATLAEPRDALRLDTVERPQAGPGEVLVRIAAVSVNFADVLLARGQYQVRPELPFVPGVEASGVIAALGEGVDGFTVGDRVAGVGIGMLAEYVAVPAQAVHRLPDELDFDAASGLMVAYQTAWFGLHHRARLRAGDWLLVHAAAGGVGAAAVQLGVAAGARVIAVVGDDRKAEAARASGAEIVLRRGDDDLVAKIREITGGRGVDVVFDPVGGASFVASTRVVAFEGRIIVVGFAGGEMQSMSSSHLLVKNYDVIGLYWATYQDQRPALVAEAHDDLMRLFRSGAITPGVDSVAPFDDAPAAFERLAAGAAIGRAVIRVST